MFLINTAHLIPISLLLQLSAVETDSEEYRTHNDTESDIEVEKGVVVIQDLETVQVNHHLSSSASVVWGGWL